MPNLPEVIICTLGKQEIKTNYNNLKVIRLDNVGEFNDFAKFENAIMGFFGEGHNFLTEGALIKIVHTFAKYPHASGVYTDDVSGHINNYHMSYSPTMLSKSEAWLNIPFFIKVPSNIQFNGKLRTLFLHDALFKGFLSNQFIHIPEPLIVNNTQYNTDDIKHDTKIINESTHINS